MSYRNHNMYAGHDSPNRFFFWVLVIIFVPFIIYLTHGCNMRQWVSDDAALQRLALKFPPNTHIEILSDSGNEIFLLHNPADVIFELRVRYPDGRVFYPSARCSKSFFAEMVCRIYSDALDDNRG